MSDRPLLPMERVALLSTKAMLESSKEIEVPGENPFADIGPAAGGSLDSTHRRLMVVAPETANTIIGRIDQALNEGTLGAALPVLRLLQRLLSMA